MYLDLVDWKAIVMLAGVWGRSHTLPYLFVDSLAEGLQMVVIFCSLPRRDKIRPRPFAFFHVHFSHIVLSSSA